MNRTRLATVFAALALSVATVGSAAAFPFSHARNAMASGPTVTFGGEVVAPIGLHIFCRTSAGQCGVRRGHLPTNASGAVVYSPRLLAQLRNVHRSVNASIRPVSDSQQHGMIDVWRVGARAGDCEDFALEKRRRLLAAGWPSSAVLIGLGSDGWGQDHAVLVVRTTAGDFVLDNQRNGVVSISSAGGSVRTIQSPTSPRRFVSAGRSGFSFAFAAN